MNDGQSEPEFVTVAEAARRLHISERQARRMMARLDPSDRQDGPPVRVRFDALPNVAAPLRHRPDSVTGNAGQRPDTRAGHYQATPDSSPDIRDGQREGEQTALVAALQGEVTFLRAALEREQGIAQAALQALQAERDRGAVLLAAVATGRLVLPGTGEGGSKPDILPDNAGHERRTMPDTVTAENTSQTPLQTPETNETGTGDTLPSEGERGAKGGQKEGMENTINERSRPWWQVWKGKEKA